MTIISITFTFYYYAYNNYSTMLECKKKNALHFFYNFSVYFSKNYILIAGPARVSRETYV